MLVDIPVLAEKLDQPLDKQHIEELQVPRPIRLAPKVSKPGLRNS